MKRPSFQFYPGDWLHDVALRTVSVAARGLWMDMICLMHQGTPYGHLKVNSKVIDEISLGRMTGVNNGEIKNLLDELESSGVFSRANDGAIYSKRMVADEVLRNKRADGGSKGGNPDLGVNYNIPGFVYAMSRSNGDIKIGISVSPDKRAYKLRKALSDESIIVVAKRWVEDMGAEESALHATHAEYRIGETEWFCFPQDKREAVIESIIHLKVNSKANQTPSSSSSSSSSKEKDQKKGAALSLPPWLQESVWADWHDFRNTRKGWTPKARALSLSTLAKLREQGHDPKAVVEQSIERGWTGLFPIRSESHANRNSCGAVSAAERVAAVNAEAERRQSAEVIFGEFRNVG